MYIRTLALAKSFFLDDFIARKVMELFAINIIACDVKNQHMGLNMSYGELFSFLYLSQSLKTLLANCKKHL